MAVLYPITKFDGDTLQLDHGLDLKRVPDSQVTQCPSSQTLQRRTLVFLVLGDGLWCQKLSASFNSST